MIRLLAQALAGSVAGMLAGAGWLVLAYALNPRLELEMDRGVAAVAQGFYDEERAGHETFAWTGREAHLNLPGLDRKTSWSCTVRVRGGRPDPATLPEISMAVDGGVIASRRATNDYQDLRVEISQRPASPGAVVTLRSSNTFRPGPSDPRELGVMVDRWACEPAPGHVPLPPRQAVGTVTATGALFGAAFALIGLTPGGMAAAAAILAAGQAVVIARGVAVFTPFLANALWLAFWIALALAACVRVVESRSGDRFRNTARFAVAFSAGALYLKLLALFHPSKLLVDAVFHAHRFESVLRGGFYFTQPLPSGVRFPYAIGLYLFAAPWSVLTSDYVTLLRIIVCATEAVAGALMYLMIVRIWGGRLTAAVAVALFHFVPLSYWVIGNANLTNAFGASAALMAVVAAAVWPLRPGHRGQLAGLTVLSSLALLSHVSTFALLLTTMVAIAGAYRWLGGASLAGPARSVLVATSMAVLVSTVTYYGHFGDVYAGLARVPANVPTESAVVPDAAPGPTPIGARIAEGLVLIVDAVGWPILLLAVVGAWRLWADGARDRLVMILLAWGVAFVIFFAIGTVPAVERPFQRYAAEFVGRVVHATYPAAIVLAARGGVWGWQARGVLRGATVSLFVAAVLIGTVSWLAWLR